MSNCKFCDMPSNGYDHQKTKISLDGWSNDTCEILHLRTELDIYKRLVLAQEAVRKSFDSGNPGVVVAAATEQKERTEELAEFYKTREAIAK